MPYAAATPLSRIYCFIISFAAIYFLRHFDAAQKRTRPCCRRATLFRFFTADAAGYAASREFAITHGIRVAWRGRHAATPMLSASAYY